MHEQKEGEQDIENLLILIKHTQKRMRQDSNILNHIIMGSYCVGCHKMDFKSKFEIGESALRSISYVKKLNANHLSTIWLVETGTSKTLRTLKVTDKLQLCRRQCLQLPINEQNILRRLNSPFLVNILAAFQDQQSLYILLEYMPFGNLRNYLHLQGSLDEQSLKFASICIFLALQYLHSKGFAHLDLKPENILIDNTGYFRLCDFNLSQPVSKIKKNSKLRGIGTSGYKPPELRDERARAGFETDYYSAGVVLYQLLTKKNIPNILAITEEQIVSELVEEKLLSNNCVDFILALLERNPDKRLGASGIRQIWNHPWMQIDPNTKDEYRGKRKPSIVTDMYIEKYSRLSKQIEEEEMTSNDEDEFVKKIYTQEPQFQKFFAQFKTLDRIERN